MDRDKCTDPAIGALLHAYELDALPEPEAEQFETHLLTCQHCYNEVVRFSKESNLLRFDDMVHRLASRGAAGSGESHDVSAAARLKSYFWPDAPLFLRPAFVVTLLLLMIYPAFVGIRSLSEQKVRTLEAIDLFPSRSSSDAFQISDDRDVVISFVYPDYETRHNYALRLEGENGRVLYLNDAFSELDSFGAGKLLVPGSQLRPGSYELSIADSAGDRLNRKQIYRFTVRK